ncbi:uncharacterized protein LOC109854314 [Pseudomyrmex gracilis]|uniref:uncharacterized protein LOC109854314 n=1 Tax=Pseudomyrmex gracilis TaxID=219809 RepID=UPI0009956A18|nr:uncharacterized protein LOC109854314 [Pseudomyrmex gracilis]
MVHTSYAQWACLPSTYRKKVNPGSKAAQQGVREGDLISTINGKSTRDLTNSEAHTLLRTSGEQLKLGLNQDNIGSPKRRIYKSSLQENTTTEIHNKITTKTTTTTRTRTEAEKNVANDTKVEQNYANQNGTLKSCPSEQQSDIKKDRAKLPGSVNIELSESENNEMEERWRALSTEDPRVLVCLSPSQQATQVRTSADTLLDLHCKFLNRYSYRNEHPQRVPLPQYRVHIHAPSNAKEDNDNAASRTPRPPARAPHHHDTEKSRLFEIIKEERKHPRNETVADNRRTTTDDTWNVSIGDQERLKAVRTNDWLNHARRDRRSATANELFLAAARGEDGEPSDDKTADHVARPDQLRITTRSMPNDDAVHDSDRPSASHVKSSFALNSAIIDRSMDTTTAKRTSPSLRRTTDPSKHVNPALIDDKLEVPPLPKRTVTVDRSCIDTTSIFDQNPPRSHLEPRRATHDTTAEKLKHVAAVEIMDKLKKLQTETSRRLDGGDRRGSLPQEYFVQQLNYIELLEEQLKNVILAEEEERKAFEEYQTHFRRTKQSDDAKKFSLTDIREETWNETNPNFERERKIPIDILDEESPKLKRAENKEEKRRSNLEEEEENHSKKTRRNEPEIQKEFWQEKSRNVEKDRTETIDKTGSRQFLKKVYCENGIREESSESVEHEECYRLVARTGGNAENDGTSELRKNEANDDEHRAESEELKNDDEKTSKQTSTNLRSSNVVEAKRPTTLPTNGEAFRQRMYDEYVHKVLERQERKNHKIVKISSREDIKNGGGKKSSGGENMSEMAKEFIEKARSRLSKFGINLDESGTELEEDENDVINAKFLIDGKELRDTRKLPKHLREFLKISTMNDDGEGGSSCDNVARGRDNDNGGLLLREIDNALRIGKGFLLGQENVMFAPTFKASSAKPGVWSPGQTPPAKESPNPDRTKEPQKNEPIPPVWTPASAGASPVAEKKEFRPVPFESPVLSRKKQSKEEETPPPWENDKRECSRSVYESSARIVNSHSAPSQGLNTLASTPRLPRAQNPTITLLQKAREGQLPKGAAYLEENEPVDNRPSSDERPLISPGEIIYAVKKEYESEPEMENEPPKKMADLGPRKFEGIGPVTREGIPLVLRSEVKESNQAKWYKKMYDSLHRADRNDDYVTIKYRQRRGGRYGYGSSSGYLSEPEPRVYSDRSVTLDSRRRLRNKENDFTTATMPRK